MLLLKKQSGLHLKRVVGAYVILIMDNADPETIIAARKGSPLVIGIGKGEHFLGSDASPMLEYTKEVVYVNDYELAIIKPGELVLKNLGNEKITPYVQKLDLDLAAIEKGGYDHFMLKEIFEQPQTIYRLFAWQVRCRSRNDHDERHSTICRANNECPPHRHDSLWHQLACGFDS